jgi:hypothetical protein
MSRKQPPLDYFSNAEQFEAMLVTISTQLSTFYNQLIKDGVDPEHAAGLTEIVLLKLFGENVSNTGSDD